jgi:hypothetical protein
MPIRLLTSGGGTTTIQPTTSASSVTLTVPSVNANVVTTGDTASVTQAMLGSGLAGTGPTFSAYLSSTQSLTGGVWTKIQFNTEEWDTANCYDNSTNYRFTPNVAGYYQVNLMIQNITTTYSGQNYVSIYKNGSALRFSMISTYGLPVLSSAIYLNGSTDYIEGHLLLGTSQNVTSSQSNLFQAFLARAA